MISDSRVHAQPRWKSKESIEILIRLSKYEKQENLHYTMLVFMLVRIAFRGIVVYVVVYVVSQSSFMSASESLRRVSSSRENCF